MIRGKKFVCSQCAMAAIFYEDEMVLLYRFSIEIEKDKNSLDLNLGPTVETVDHIVPSVANTRIVNHIGGEGFKKSTANVYGFHHVSRGRRFRTSVPSPTYDPHYYTPILEAFPGSEYVGYAPNDLNIVATNVPPIPRNQQPIEVSSNGSSTDVKTIVETGAEANFSKIERTCFGNHVHVEKDIRESSKQGNLGTTEDLTGVMNTENIEQPLEDEGNNGGDAGED
ncbi:hypothetical protein Bca101_032822 [Brassica carinata]